MKSKKKTGHEQIPRYWILDQMIFCSMGMEAVSRPVMDVQTVTASSMKESCWLPGIPRRCQTTRARQRVKMEISPWNTEKGVIDQFAIAIIKIIYHSQGVIC